MVAALGQRPRNNVAALGSMQKQPAPAYGGGTMGRQPSAANQRLGQAQPQAYSPTTDLSSAQTANYNDWFANNDKTGQQMQQIAAQQAAMEQRKAAYLASMSGGNGGYYQGGQIAAGIAGQNAMNQALLANNQARDQIYSQKGSALNQLATGAQSYGNQMGLQTQQQQWTAGREDQKAKADAQTSGIQAQAARAKSRMDSLFGKNPNSDVWYGFNDLQSQLDKAIMAGDFTTAQAIADQMNNYDVSGYGGDGKSKSKQYNAAGYQLW